MNRHIDSVVQDVDCSIAGHGFESRLYSGIFLLIWWQGGLHLSCRYRMQVLMVEFRKSYAFYLKQQEKAVAHNLQTIEINNFSGDNQFILGYYQFLI